MRVKIRSEDLKSNTILVSASFLIDIIYVALKTMTCYINDKMIYIYIRKLFLMGDLYDGYNYSTFKTR